ncbi:helix-turn-helix protein [anaerobic digester metagenome]
MYQKFEILLCEKNVTAYKVAKETGVSSTTLTEWKKGTYVPKLDKLQKIADYFGVSITYFLGD